MKAISQGDIYEIYSDSMNTYEQLPAQVYTIRFHKMKGFYLEKTADIEIKEDKIYGVHEEKVDKVLRSFVAFNRNLGVILSGDKGIGKSLFAKLLATKAVSNGYPMIIADTYFPGIASYIESIEQECIIMFDEFDKTFGDVKAEDGMASPQTELLTLFDGMASGKKLFVITCNDLRKLNEFLVNRPGRFHYHFRFEYPSAEEVREYLKDKLPENRHEEIPEVVAFSRKVRLNYDCLRAIAFEISTGYSFKDAIADLNIINLEEERYTLVLQFENGLVGMRKSIRLDLFGDGEDTYAWVEDKRGYTFARVDFNPADAFYDTKLMANVIPGDKITVAPYDDRDYDDDKEFQNLLQSAKTSKVRGLIIKREYDKGIHYAL